MKHGKHAISLDEIDRRSYAASGSPPHSPATGVTLLPGKLRRTVAVATRIPLDGEWELVEGGDEADRLSAGWGNSVSCEVPGSVHTALVRAGRVPEPTVGRNQPIVAEESYKRWWYRKRFPRPARIVGARLLFGGVCNRCTVWLNGRLLGLHEGMFGGPEFDLGDVLQDENELVVRLDAIPRHTGRQQRETENSSWRNTVVFNNVYGWHYSQLPSLGIWRSVWIESTPEVAILEPFISTRDAKAGLVDLVFDIGRTGAERHEPMSGSSDTRDGAQRPAATLPAVVRGEISMKDNPDRCWQFERRLEDARAGGVVHLRFNIPEPCLWWPVDLGTPALYRLHLELETASGGDAQEVTFGIRSVEMTPLPGGPEPERYNWTFTINGEAHFVKGTGWCTMDPLMDFSRSRYARLIELAGDQHVQMLRAWGSGMPETDEFYELCDEHGIMVMQEWPTAWNSHRTQPYGMLEETVRRNTLRLRNHPSLVMWGAGNESRDPFGPAIDMMGRLSIELDGSRPFHRGEPWGGSRHDYTCYWGRSHLDHNLAMTADFFGEFGLASSPVYESVCRYLPEEERTAWPADEAGAFAYHLPIFNIAAGLSRQRQYAGYFLPESSDLRTYTIASQMAQTVAVRHTLERARCRWPDCSGSLYYKLNDNFPAVSWASVDWYGAPKMGHYFFQDAFSPLHACVLFETVRSYGTPLDLPVYLLDDANALDGKHWKVIVRAFDSELAEIRRSSWEGKARIDAPLRLAAFRGVPSGQSGRGFALTFEESLSAPIFIVAEVHIEASLADRTFYWINFEERKGCLFDLPPTRLSLSTGNRHVVLKNSGSLPAVGACVSQPGRLDTFRASDNYLWLDPGEEQAIEVNDTDGVTCCGWNVR